MKNKIDDLVKTGKIDDLVKADSLVDVLRESAGIRWLQHTDPYDHQVMNRPMADLAVWALVTATALDDLRSAVYRQRWYQWWKVEVGYWFPGPARMVCWER